MVIRIDSDGCALEVEKYGSELSFRMVHDDGFIEFCITSSVDIEELKNTIRMLENEES